MRKIPTVDNVDKCDGCIYNTKTSYCRYPGDKQISINGWNPRGCVYYGIGNDFNRRNYIYVHGVDISKETIII